MSANHLRFQLEKPPLLSLCSHPDCAMEASGGRESGLARLLSGGTDGLRRLAASEAFSMSSAEGARAASATGDEGIATDGG